MRVSLLPRPIAELLTWRIMMTVAADRGRFFDGCAWLACQQTRPTLAVILGGPGTRQSHQTA